MKRFAVLGAVVFALFTAASPVAASHDFAGSAGFTTLSLTLRQTGLYRLTFTVTGHACHASLYTDMGRGAWVDGTPEGVTITDYKVPLSAADYTVKVYASRRCAWDLAVLRRA